MKKYIKDHKIVVAAIIFLLILLVFAYIAKQVFFSGGSNTLYGSRLEGIDAVKVSKSAQKNLINKIEEDSAVKKCEYALQGKIINVIITVNDDVGLDTAKSLANKVLEEFDTDQKSFYDFQVFVKKDNDASDFPIIGYKQNKKEGFTWTKDRVAE